MKKNNNIDILVEKIMSSDKLMEELSELDSMEQIYDFCQSIQGGYTKEEFAVFVDEMLFLFIKESLMNAPSIKSVKDDDIQAVAGGAKIDIKRIIAAGLASLSFISAPKFNSAYAAADISGVGDAAVVQQHREITKKGGGKLEKSPGIWSRFKSTISSIKNKIMENKGKVAILGALVLGAMYAYSRREDISAEWESYSKDKAEKQADKKRDIEHLARIRTQYHDDLKALHTYAKNPDTATPLTPGMQQSLVNTYNTVNKTTITLDTLNNNSDIRNSAINSRIALLRDQIPKLDEDLSKARDGHWYSGIPVVAQTAATLGMTAKIIKAFYNYGGGALASFRNLNETVTGIYNAGFAASNMAQGTADKIDLWLTNLQKEELSRMGAAEKLDEGLKSVRGQEPAKKAARGFLNSVIMEKDRQKALGKKDTHAHVIVFNGPSGIGKSFTAERLAIAISNSLPYRMSASEVDVNSSKNSILAQLFGDRYGYRYDANQQENRNFVKYIKDHPDDGVVIINEYDKMCVRDAKDHPLDEVMRTFMDEGKATINGQVIDCSGITFILTTNESEGSLQGKVTIDPITNKLVDPTIGSDTTGSRTIVKHDKSFLNRLTIVPFENLTAKEYEQIARDKFAPTIEFLKTPEGGNLDLLISDESYEKMGKYTERVNEGARTVDKILAELFTTIVEKVFEIKEEGENDGVKEEQGENDLKIKLKAEYDDEHNEFSLI
ncbi:MAG: AAA family ATPase [Oscillospiraceae bacterium]|jgi:ATP-dependent Clp protease ATP-binding subunit ClpA|nr:AAA family ATPase [Oscillospiraceae bacterium]